MGSKPKFVALWGLSRYRLGSRRRKIVSVASKLPRLGLGAAGGVLAVFPRVSSRLVAQPKLGQGRSWGQSSASCPFHSWVAAPGLFVGRGSLGSAWCVALRGCSCPAPPSGARNTSPLTPPYVVLLLHRAGSGAARLPARPSAAPPGTHWGLLLFFYGQEMWQVMI